MTQNASNRRNKIGNSVIILFSIIGLIVCIAVLFPQVRHLIINMAGQMLHREIYPEWHKTLFNYALGAICFILFVDYCTLIHSGRMLVKQTKKEITDCLSEIDFRSLLKPVLIMLVVYLLGIFTIIRANYLYIDDMARSIEGYRIWYNWSRYVNELLSIFIHADTNLTDISPLPQLLAAILLSISSVLLVYIICEGKITTTRLLASVPLGLSPYFLQCLSYKFDAPYMAISVLASIIPFLFIARKKAFLFWSVVSLLIMCMTYQVASGIYLLIVAILCFQQWNGRKASNKEILSFAGIALSAFCLAMILFKFFLMRDSAAITYASTAMHPLPHMVSGILTNINQYATTINDDFGLIWKIGIVLVLILFIIKSIHSSLQNRILAFFVSILMIGLSFILSFGIYLLLTKPIYFPRALFGFGVFLAILCIYVVSDFNKIATVTVLALNWCFFVFAFSYGNALADHARYEGFRIEMLLHDLSTLYPNVHEETLAIQLENSMEYPPSIRNISKHYPVIKKLISTRLGEDFDGTHHWLKYVNYPFRIDKETSIDFNALDLPVVLDSYYHTIKSDGIHCLVILKH